MECNSGFNTGLQQEMPFSVPSSTVQSLGTDVQSDDLVTHLGKHFVEFGRLFLTFLSLYFQGRILVAQNFVLSCKLQVWEVVFVYFKLQIFFVRLANGFPVSQCWPRK